MFYCFLLHYLLSTFLLEMAKNLFGEISDGVLCEALSRKFRRQVGYFIASVCRSVCFVASTRGV